MTLRQLRRPRLGCERSSWWQALFELDDSCFLVDVPVRCPMLLVVLVAGCWTKSPAPAPPAPATWSEACVQAVAGLRMSLSNNTRARAERDRTAGETARTAELAGKGIVPDDELTRADDELQTRERDIDAAGTVVSSQRAAAWKACGPAWERCASSVEKPRSGCP